MNNTLIQLISWHVISQSLRDVDTYFICHIWSVFCSHGMRYWASCRRLWLIIARNNKQLRAFLVFTVNTLVYKSTLFWKHIECQLTCYRVHWFNSFNSYFSVLLCVSGSHSDYIFHSWAVSHSSSLYLARTRLQFLFHWGHQWYVSSSRARVWTRVFQLD